MNKNAFTLAEVLITFGIIGVVAAMTLPNLTGKYKTHLLKNQFMSNYSLISQAIQNMSVDDPNINSTYCKDGIDKTENIFIQDFAKNFQVVKRNYSATNDLKKLGYNRSYFYQTSPGNEHFNIDGHNNGAIILKNGAMIASSGCWWKNDHVDFIVDINGTKEPNRFGYDVFYFQVGDNNKLYPSAGNYNLQGTSEDKMIKCCNFKENGTCISDTGSSCALYAIRDQYPHDKNLKYWDSLKF